MILAGVTGVSWGLKSGEGAIWSIDVLDDELEEVVAGGAGGGIERSTGEGVSPTTSPAVLPFLDRVERRSGVDVVDFDPR